MIVVFYLLYVWVHPARFSWLWAIIAFVMNVWQLLRRQSIEEAIYRAIDRAENNQHLGGPF